MGEVIQFPAITPDMQRLCDRAAAHSVNPADLPTGARFQGALTDLDVARVCLAVERGGEIVAAGGQYRWMMLGPQRHGRAELSRIVDEMIRTGLAVAVSLYVGRDVVRVGVQLAPVHLRARTRALGAYCSSRKLRLRLTDDPDLVDCPSCRHRVRS